MKPSNRSRGFSLVEMLVVIAITGIMAGFALPQISDFSRSAKEAKAKRNAQNIAAVASQAMSAGFDFVGTNSREQAIANVIEGTTSIEGVFEGEFFGVPNLSLIDAQQASEYLDIGGQTLQYHPDGGLPQIPSLPAPNM